MFNVEGIGLGARFADVAGLVGVPARQWAPSPCPPRDVLAEHYLGEYVVLDAHGTPVLQFSWVLAR